MQRNPTTRSVTWILLALGLALLAGCEDFSFLGELGEVPRPLELAPSTASLVPGQTVTFEATGGTPPYAFTLLSGGGTIDPASGQYSAVLPGTDTVGVVDQKGTARQATISISAIGGLIVFPPSPTVTRNQSLQLVASGGTPPYTFVLTTALSGGSVNAADGTYTAGSIAAVSDVVTVTDSTPLTPFTFAVTIAVADLVTNVQYEATAFTFPANAEGGTAVLPGSPFTLTNTGSADGMRDVRWAVYRSTDAVLNSGDQVLCSGTHPALAAGDSADVDLTGAWPFKAGTWHLIVALSAADDLSPGDHWFAAPGTVTVSAADIQYTVDAANLFGGPALTGGLASGDFQLRNDGALPGTVPVSWTVYASKDTMLGPGDAVIDFGTHAPVGAVPQLVPFSGIWPAAPDDYHLLVKIAAEDDTDPADNLFATAATTITCPIVVVDYRALNVTHLSGLVAGDAVSGNFDLSDSGLGDGVLPVNWRVYASAGDTVLGPGDTLLDEGTEFPVDGVTIIPNIPFSGTWPLRTGSHYLLVRVSADDDANHGNDLGFSAELTLQPTDVDYTVDPLPPPGGTTRPGDMVSGTFVFRNLRSQPGSATVAWSVFASTNETLDANDVYIDSDTDVPLPPFSPSGSIGFSGNWPLVYGQYHLLVRVSAADDLNPANNLGTTPPGTPTAVGIYDETVSDAGEDYLTMTDFFDLGITLQPGMRLKVTGTIDDTTDLEDIFGFLPGSATVVTTSITWGTPGCAAIYYWYGDPDTPSTHISNISLTTSTTTRLAHVLNAISSPKYHYIDFENKDDAAPPPNNFFNLGSYTMIISAD